MKARTALTLVSEIPPPSAQHPIGGSDEVIERLLGARDLPVDFKSVIWKIAMLDETKPSAFKAAGRIARPDADTDAPEHPARDGAALGAFVQSLLRPDRYYRTLRSYPSRLSQDIPFVSNNSPPCSGASQCADRCLLR